ncbi:MAG TPA: flagellar hook-basal body complex protein FliE [Bacillales bacterium]|nr:flagellar hook-basal body complex protein FliE [Bacillales bacterium]
MERIENLSMKPMVPQKPELSAAESGEAFTNMLNDALNEVNQAQNESDEAAKRLINGEAVNLHNVMIAAEKAEITLTAAVEIRNKVVDAYKSIMRMQL